MCAGGLSQAAHQVPGMEMAEGCFLNCWVPKFVPILSGGSTQLLPLPVSRTPAARREGFPPSPGLLSKMINLGRKGLKIQTHGVLKEMTNHREALQLESPPARGTACWLQSGCILSVHPSLGICRDERKRPNKEGGGKRDRASTKCQRHNN